MGVSPVFTDIRNPHRSDSQTTDIPGCRIAIYWTRSTGSLFQSPRCKPHQASSHRNPSYMNCHRFAADRPFLHRPLWLPGCRCPHRSTMTNCSNLPSRTRHRRFDSAFDHHNSRRVVFPPGFLQARRSRPDNQSRRPTNMCCHTPAALNRTFPGRPRSRHSPPHS